MLLEGGIGRNNSGSFMLGSYGPEAGVRFVPILFPIYRVPDFTETISFRPTVEQEVSRSTETYGSADEPIEQTLSWRIAYSGSRNDLFGTIPRAIHQTSTLLGERGDKPAIGF